MKRKILHSYGVYLLRDSCEVFIFKTALKQAFRDTLIGDCCLAKQHFTKLLLEDQIIFLLKVIAVLLSTEVGKLRSATNFCAARESLKQIIKKI